MDALSTSLTKMASSLHALEEVVQGQRTEASTQSKDSASARNALQVKASLFCFCFLKILSSKQSALNLD